MTTMTELSNSIRIQAHRANIERYRKLLATGLTRVEREYVMRRIAEERAGLRRLEDGADDMPAPLCGAGSPLAERQKHAAALCWEQRL
jgi:hypothetical protein